MEFARVTLLDFNSNLRGKVVPLNLLQQNVKIVDAVVGCAIDNSIPQDVHQLLFKDEIFALDPHKLSHLCLQIENDSSLDGNVLNTPRIGNGGHYENASQSRPIHRVERIPWHINHYFILGGAFNDNGEPHPLCSRNALCRALEKLSDLGEHMACGFELEFSVTKNGLPYPCSAADQALSMHDIDEAANFLDEVATNLREMGINVNAIHREGFVGQYEIALRHRDALRATEDAILGREVIRCTARRHGLAATFAPGLLGPGNRGHVHASLSGRFKTNDVFQNERADNVWVGADNIGQAFMAGVVHALPWMTFVVMGSLQGFRSAIPGELIGVYKAWGVETRDTPIRLASDRSNFEMRNGDSCANPYLVSAAIAVAGAIGIKRKMKLAPPCSGNPHEQQHSGVEYERLPRNMTEAISAFQKACSTDEDLAAVFPTDMVRVWTAVKYHETQYALKHGQEKLNNLLGRLI